MIYNIPRVTEKDSKKLTEWGYNMINSLFPITQDFDDVFEDFATNVLKSDSGYPKWNLAKVDDDLILSVAVTGIPKENIEVYLDDEDLLTIESNVETDDHEYVYKGYPVKSFKKKFSIDKRFEVGTVIHENGELSVRLNRKTPTKRDIPIIGNIHYEEDKEAA